MAAARILHSVRDQRGTAGPRLAYDGDCPLCVGMVGMLARARLVPGDRIRAYQDYEGELAGRLWDAGIRNEIAVVDETSGEIRSGVDGLVWILRSSWARPIVAVLALPPLLAITRACYRVVAYNRHLLAPKDPARMRCACDADFHLGYRVALLAPALAFPITIAFLALPVSLAALACAAGAIAAAVGLRGMSRERAFDWLGHVVLALDAAAIALLPALVLSHYLEAQALRGVLVGRDSRRRGRLRPLAAPPRSCDAGTARPLDSLGRAAILPR